MPIDRAPSQNHPPSITSENFSDRCHLHHAHGELSSRIRGLIRLRLWDDRSDHLSPHETA
jgi:hypothetical protein